MVGDSVRDAFKRWTRRLACRPEVRTQSTETIRSDDQRAPAYGHNFAADNMEILVAIESSALTTAVDAAVQRHRITYPITPNRDRAYAGRRPQPSAPP